MTRASIIENQGLDGCMVCRAIEGMCVGLVVMNPAARVTWMNRTAEKLLGVRRADCEGRLLGQILKDPQFAAFWQAAQTDDDTVMGAVSLHWPKVCELKVNSTLCFDNDGGPAGRALLFCDVTQERTAQVELTREVADRLLSMTVDNTEQPTLHSGLTAQELHVLRLVGNGLGNQDISEQMHVAPSTLRSHLKHIYRKTGLRTRAEAVRYAVENGLH